MFYRLKSCIILSFYNNRESARLREIGGFGFNLLSFHDLTRNSFYANKKEPRVQTQFLVAGVERFVRNGATE